MGSQSPGGPWHRGKALLTGAVDIHVDGLLVALRLQEQQLRDDQTGDTVVDLQVGRGGVSPDRGEGIREAVMGRLRMSQGTRMGVRAQGRWIRKTSEPRRRCGAGWGWGIQTQVVWLTGRVGSVHTGPRKGRGKEAGESDWSPGLGRRVIGEGASQRLGREKQRI